MKRTITLFHSNGKKASYSEYKNNKKNGLWQTWDINGNLASTCPYKDGIICDTWIRWNKDNTVFICIFSGKTHAKGISYNSQGEKVSEGFYNNRGYKNGEHTYTNNTESKYFISGMEVHKDYYLEKSKELIINYMIPDLTEIIMKYL